MATYQRRIENPPKSGDEFRASRVEKIAAVESVTHRPLIIYFSNFIKAQNIPNNIIDDTDVTAFSDLIEPIRDRDALDVLLHSPGGLAESAERIVYLLRQNFKSVRFAVPHTAYSAATLMTLSGDEILMDDRSALGPIDPQLAYVDQRTGQVFQVPTQAIVDGWETAREECRKDPEALSVYYPLLAKLDLHIFEICKNAERLSQDLALEWLRKYMLKEDSAAEEKARRVVEYLSRHRERRSHRRPISVSTAKELGLKVVDMRSEPELRKRIWELYCDVEFFVDHTNTAKFYENAYGVSWRRQFQVQQLEIQIPVQPVPPQAAPKPSPQ